ncbi:hypothetical protein NP493_1716g00002 [Ridgeia piscesae]|uniref:Uncharacterized protein n=1 Tax=Ridgeia piscesae TaxID=27915 RepID=A0AAD9N7B4_RIDPI|nr:hypothetical protein NP493_1716g00002 [Ridgeia piscesae]
MAAVRFKYNMQKRTRSHTSRSCGGRSCSGPSKQIRICSCGYGQCMTFPESAVRCTFPNGLRNGYRPCREVHPG